MTTSWQSEREKRSIRNSKIQIVGIVLIGALTLIWIFWILQSSPPYQDEIAYDTQCVVTRVIDGDTIECDDIPPDNLAYCLKI